VQEVAATFLYTKVVQQERAQDPSTASPQMRTQRCSGCGASLSVPAHLLSTQCTYCESPVVEVENATLGVDSVVPFVISAQAASAKINEWLRDHRWAPNEVRRLGHDARALRPIYVPHSVYAGEVRARYHARIGIVYTKTIRRGKKTTTVIKTDWHSLRGTYGRSFEGHLVSASQGLLEATSNQLEPFDLGMKQPFDPRLVAGIEAELPTHASGITDQVLVDELKHVTQAEILHDFLPGEQQELRDLTVSATIATRSITALPIWLATFHHDGAVHHCFVNGQTGAVVGEVPKSTAKIVVTILIVAAVLFGAWALWGAR